MIDIFLPFWGDPKLLYEAIDSVRAQDDPGWKLTIVDDCYPDETVGPTVEGIDDERIVYTRNKKNLGITENYRRCLELATEDTVVFFGCDDIMLPGYVSTIARAQELFPEADVIQPGVQTIDENGRVVASLVDRVKSRMLAPRADRPVLLAGQDAAASLLRGNWLYWPSLAFRRPVLESHDFRDGFPIIQDLGLVVDILADGGRLLSYPSLCFQYRRHSASASSATALAGKRFVDDGRYFDLAAQQMASLGWQRASRIARRRWISRIHALTMLPAASRADREGARILARYAFGRSVS